ncbi:glycosyltransferase [Cytobacillus spongiae]|uniref:glycosyltransferase n=1 Tax=Cytobacillus spongiae TaxID=2901381 RepID=UPI001F1E409C|nr:glycosyltransferase [Cytobacillus spongiae]UII55685.1 glycosyltransferase [Cytobacillus spongiae]
MKVLHLISGGETGGSRKHVITLLSQFPKDTVALAVLQEGALSQEAREAGIEVALFKQASRYDVSVLNQVVRYMESEGFDILHTHGARANLFGLYIASRVKKKWVTTVHSDPSLDFMKSGIKGTIFTKLHLMALKRMDHYFAVSEVFKSNLVGMGIPKKQIQTIYNGIHFSQDKAVPVPRQSLGVSDENFVITMVARLHPIKGHELVFQAIKELNNPRVKLLLVGDGPIRRELEDKVKAFGLLEQVHFLGFRKDVDRVYAASTIGLLASYSESFPLALLEAANQRIPLITTDVGGVKELVTNGETGWIVPVGEVEQLKKAIQQSYELWMSDDLVSYGERLYHHAASRFSLEQIYTDTMNTYHAIV